MICWLWLACTSPELPSTIEGPEDHTMNFGEKTGSIQLISPVYRVPPYTEQEKCLFYQYDGPEMYFTKGISYQNPNFGHHADIDVGMLGQPYDLSEVGSSCEKAMDFIWNPIVEAKDTLGDGIAYGDYPPGMGYKLIPGTMIMLQSHHINTTNAEVLVNDRFDIHLSPPEEITYPAAPIELGSENFSISQGAYEHSFDCPIEEEVQLAWIAGHMHEYGAYQYIDRLRDGEIERLYGVDTWLEEYYLTAPVEEFLPNGSTLLPGDILRVTCGWDNDSGGVLEHPTEMCYSGGIIFPHEAGIYCDNSPHQEDPSEPSTQPQPYEPPWNSGSLLITEIQIDPCGEVLVSECSLADTNEEFDPYINIGWGEWFEILNTTDQVQNLAGVTINVGEYSHTFTQDYFLKPDSFAVLGNNEDYGSNGLVRVDTTFPAWLSFPNESTTISLYRDGYLLDEIHYTNDQIAKIRGKSLSLDIDYFHAQGNDISTHWCRSTTQYGDGDFGTPGKENDPCP